MTGLTGHFSSFLLSGFGTFQVEVCVGPVGFSVFSPSNHILNDLQHHLSQRVPWHLLDVLARQFGSSLVIQNEGTQNSRELWDDSHEPK
jgi:hypothetical protein